MKKFVLYTAVFGDRPSRFRFPDPSIPDVDRFCYTDYDVSSGCHQMLPVRKDRFIKNDYYEVKKMRLDHLTPRMRNRFVKILIPDEIFYNYEFSVYVDCKHPLKVDFDKYVALLDDNDPPSDFLARQHPRRGCVYDESRKCLGIGKGDRKTILKQMAFYRSEGLPTYNGLYAGYWLFRRHTKRLKEFMKLWWEQLIQFPDRDQLSLPYIAWKYDVSIPIYCRPRRPKGIK